MTLYSGLFQKSDTLRSHINAVLSWGEGANLQCSLRNWALGAGETCNRPSGASGIYQNHN